MPKSLSRRDKKLNPSPPWFLSGHYSRAVWMYYRFNLSVRDIKELMYARGVAVSYETIRRWVDKFGAKYAKRIRCRFERSSPVCNLDEVYTKINGKMVYLWRAIDDEVTVLDVVVQRRRNTKAALRLMSKLMKNQGVKPKQTMTDRLGSYEAALKAETFAIRGRKQEQSRRMLTRSYPAERTKVTEILICHERSKTDLRSRPNLQFTKPSTTSHHKKYYAKVQAPS